MGSSSKWRRMMYIAGKPAFIICLATAGFVKEAAEGACKCGYMYTMAK